jgi:hypothetical protein
MRKPALFVLSLVALVMAACIILLAVKYRDTRRAELTVRDQFNAALQSVAEIQDSLSAIVPLEARVLRMSQTSETGTPIGPTQKERMLSSIAELKESIRNTRERIRQLEENLATSQAEVASLTRIIDNLKRSVHEREVTISRLTARVDSLVTTVTTLRTDVQRGQETIVEQQQVIEENQQEIEAKRQEIEEKRREIAIIRYVVGTKKVLKEKGIITERGGMIGIGKSAALSGAFSEGDFTSLDTDHALEIPIRGAEPQVLSGQSRGSYELRVGRTESLLLIRDAAEFRKVKYLVIMVK